MVATYIAGSIVAADMEFGGPDVLTATIKRRVGETDVPQYARVSLLRLKDKALARQAWSNPVDGLCTFANVDASQRFTALAEYPTNPDNPATEGYMRPVAGVSLVRGEA